MTNSTKTMSSLNLDEVRQISLAGLEPHPLALAFPAYGENELAKLACDIRDHGMLQPLTLFEGKILDGRNRLEAAKKAGLTMVPSKKFEGTFDEARAYVISLNLIRRDLTTGQKAMIAADLATMPHGGIVALRGLPGKAGLLSRHTGSLIPSL